MQFGDCAPPGPAHLYEVPLWYACYTRSRAEKLVAERLSEQGVQSYLPLVPRASRWKDRRKTVLFPSFPSYVFAFFDLRALSTVLSTGGVAAVVSVAGRPVAIPPEEIEAVSRVTRLQSAGEITADPVPLEPGERVRIVDGPFGGIEGIVSRAGRHRVVVGIRAIGQGLEVDLPRGSLTEIVA